MACICACIRSHCRSSLKIDAPSGLNCSALQVIDLLLTMIILVSLENKRLVFFRNDNYTSTKKVYSHNSFSEGTSRELRSVIPHSYRSRYADSRSPTTYQKQSYLDLSASFTVSTHLGSPQNHPPSLSDASRLFDLPPRQASLSPYFHRPTGTNFWPNDLPIQDMQERKSLQ